MSQAAVHEAEQLAQATAKIQNYELTAEQTALVEKFRLEQKPADGASFNWNTLTFEAGTALPDLDSQG